MAAARRPDGPVYSRDFDPSLIRVSRGSFGFLVNMGPLNSLFYYYIFMLSLETTAFTPQYTDVKYIITLISVVVFSFLSLSFFLIYLSFLLSQIPPPPPSSFCEYEILFLLVIIARYSRAISL